MIAVGAIENQFDRRLYVHLKSSPVMYASPSVPSSTICKTRPLQSPLPSRSVTLTSISEPTSGWASSSVVSDTCTCQLCTELPEKPSYGSRLAGRYGCPPSAVQPPSDAENWVNAGLSL